MSLGKNIKFFRKQRRLTQIELAEKANMSRSYLADVERDRYNPSVDTLKSIAKALNIEAQLLLKDDLDVTEQKTFHEEKDALERSKLHNDQNTFHHDKELDDEEILILAARQVGHEGTLTKDQLDQIKLAMKIVLAKNDK
ncbi:helix-turn-helix domain-containing protein [Paenibacillus larvae]|uniref:Putative phage protein n=1 Tax=Paenibacillus larvae subsp. larvae TaxID=147375 RepID=A0A6C0QVD3_9BACL|nr:helix-turn-helix transcriptional regulator [Paenibacillus larvae]QHZ52471.1 putative phage protein [Paenibacillus larvae subsp. larvae]